MAKKNGTGGCVKTGVNVVANLNEWTTDDGINKITGRVFKDVVEQAAAGARTVTGTLKGFFDPEDTNGQALFVPGALLALELYPDGDQSGDTFDSIAEVLVENVKKGAAIDNYVSFEATFHANALPVASTVA